MADFPGPFTAEQLDAARGYYGVPGVNMSDAGAPAPAAPPPVDPAAIPLPNPADYFGAPLAHPVGAATPPPVTLAPAGPPPPPPAGAGALPPSLQATLGKTLGAPPPTAPAGPREYDPSMGAFTLTAPKPPLKELPGPTAQDDREFAALNKALVSHPARPAGGGGPANPDPYGRKAAEARLLQTYDAQAKAQEDMSVAEADRAAVRASRLNELSDLKLDDAYHERAMQLDYDERNAKMTAEAQRQLDEVRKQKVDPDRLMKGEGMQFAAIVGGMLGGMYMGLNKLQSNPFIDQLNKRIERDINTQETNIDNARKGAAEQMNLVREQRAVWKDAQMARLQTRALAYESVLTSIDAEAARADAPIAQARAEQAKQAILREKSTLERDIAARREQLAASAAASQAAQARALQGEMRKTFGDTYEKALAAGLAPAAAEQEAHRMVANQFFPDRVPERSTMPGPGGTDPLSMVPKDQRAEAAKELREHSDRENAKKLLDEAYAKYADSSVTSPSQREALKAQVRGIIKPHMKGANSDADLEKLIEPLVPAGGLTTDEAQRTKLAAAKRLLDGSGTTPILDRAAPGWKGPAPVQKFDPTGKPR